MDAAKTGALISKLRKEKGLTQKNLADMLGISNKTISKWECGMGCADLSFWPDLSSILGVDMAQMMEGEITVNKPDTGNMNKTRFYACPDCGNILVSTGSAAIFCCGRKTEALVLNENDDKPSLTVELSDIDYYITIDHPMTKDHYLSFSAYIHNDQIIMSRLYPEQSSHLRLPLSSGGKLYLYCVKHGLFLYQHLIP